ncbi:hypothetical protein C1646_674145 [Rhizophagus diaphanus]|nr:hypothetical protein C1646_674145 [Rhizophagus diaphanus] [Rhizophagus sp. MUCL 43196]
MERVKTYLKSRVKKRTDLKIKKMKEENERKRALETYPESDAEKRTDLKKKNERETNLDFSFRLKRMNLDITGLKISVLEDGLGLQISALKWEINYTSSVLHTSEFHQFENLPEPRNATEDVQNNEEIILQQNIKKRHFNTDWIEIQLSKYLEPFVQHETTL